MICRLKFFLLCFLCVGNVSSQAVAWPWIRCQDGSVRFGFGYHQLFVFNCCSCCRKKTVIKKPCRVHSLFPKATPLKLPSWEQKVLQYKISSVTDQTPGKSRSAIITTLQPNVPRFRESKENTKDNS